MDSYAMSKKPGQGWTICPVCGRQRRYRRKGKAIVFHRRYREPIAPEKYGEMVPCPGTGLPAGK